MNIKKYCSITIISLTSLLSVILGCKGETGPTGPSGPLLTGNIEGYAILYHEYDYAYPNSSGITVSLEGTTMSTMTDSTGWWKLQDITTGTYNIIFEKIGFFSKKIYSVQFVGGGTLYLNQKNYAPVLFELPSFTISSIKYSSTNSSINIDGKISSASRFGRYIFILMDTSRLVDKNNVKFWSDIYVYSDSTSFHWSIYNNYLPVKSGEWIYLKCYPASWAPNTVWDPVIRRRITYNVGEPGTALDSILVQ